MEQVVPLNSKGHRHWKLLIKLVQVPLFLHGEGAHRSTSGLETRQSNWCISVGIKQNIMKKLNLT